MAQLHPNIYFCGVTSIFDTVKSFTDIFPLNIWLYIFPAMIKTFLQLPYIHPLSPHPFLILLLCIGSGYQLFCHQYVPQKTKLKSTIETKTSILWKWVLNFNLSFEMFFFVSSKVVCYVCVVSCCSHNKTQTSVGSSLASCPTLPYIASVCHTLNTDTM